MLAIAFDRTLVGRSIRHERRRQGRRIPGPRLISGWKGGVGKAGRRLDGDGRSDEAWTVSGWYNGVDSTELTRVWAKVSFSFFSGLF